MTGVSNSPHIGVLRESPLHASVKDHYADPGARFEVPLEGFVIDVVRSDGELVEVQTGSFWPLRPKLERLLDYFRFRVVHPVPAERQVLRFDAHGELVSSRRSPLRGKFLDVFEHLVSLPTLLSHPNFSLDVVLCREEHWRSPAPKRSRRGRRVDPGQRRLVGVIDRLELNCPEDALALLPATLPEAFTTQEVATHLGCSGGLAQRFVYCLKALEMLKPAGRRGRAPLYVSTRENRQV